MVNTCSTVSFFNNRVSSNSSPSSFFKFNRKYSSDSFNVGPCKSYASRISRLVLSFSLITLGFYCASVIFTREVFAVEIKKEAIQETKLEIRQDSPKVLEELLYEAKILAPEPSDGPDDQPKLLQEAFKDVLVRASGSEKILNHVNVLKALSEVDNYVSQFGFQMNVNRERVFRVRFDETLCRELLKNAGLPQISAKRPPVVLWLVMQQDNVTQWVSRETQNELSHQLETLADKRGLTLVYPLLDLEDTAIVSEREVWAEDLNALQQASKRYNADNILIGKLSKQQSGWYAQWTYVKQDNSIRWDMSHTELASVFGEALDEFSNKLASTVSTSTANKQLAEREQENYSNSASNNVSNSASNQDSNDKVLSQGISIEPGLESTTAISKSNQSKTLHLAIVGVSGGEQYAKVLKYLQSLPSVKDVEVAEITPEQTVFKLNTEASPEAIIGSIAAGQLLVENKIENNLDNSSIKPNPTEELKSESLGKNTEVLNYKLVSMGS